ncbi:hypothetical protein V6N13_148710 [Hibiscus sabdariffa]|uniref:RWD domain-containing protein n=1 Tax=Hibiscus sabdariffa TaxID=183260 RepID=A0ABR2EJK1_9ROSI
MFGSELVQFFTPAMWQNLQVIELPIKHPELFESLGIAQPKDLDISALLLVRCLPGYPYKCLKLQIIPEKGLTKCQADTLLSLLNDQANANAREGRVMIFNLVEAAQEFLSEIVPVGQSQESVCYPHL